MKKHILFIFVYKFSWRNSWAVPNLYFWFIACQEQGVGHLIYTSSYNVVMTGQHINNGTEEQPYVDENKVSSDGLRIIMTIKWFSPGNKCTNIEIIWVIITEIYLQDRSLVDSICCALLWKRMLRTLTFLIFAHTGCGLLHAN